MAAMGQPLRRHPFALPLPTLYAKSEIATPHSITSSAVYPGR
jgi:hypothetical protein